MVGALMIGDTPVNEQAETSPADLEAGCKVVEQQVCVWHGPALPLLHQPTDQPQQEQEQEQEEGQQLMTPGRHGHSHGKHQHHHASKTPWCGQAASEQRHDLESSWNAFPDGARDCYHHP